MNCHGRPAWLLRCRICSSTAHFLTFTLPPSTVKKICYWLRAMVCSDDQRSSIMQVDHDRTHGDSRQIMHNLTGERYDGRYNGLRTCSVWSRICASYCRCIWRHLLHLKQRSAWPVVPPYARHRQAIVFRTASRRLAGLTGTVTARAVPALARAFPL